MSGEWDQMVLVGRITRPHGLRGHVVVSPETDFVDERFVAGARFRSRTVEGEIELVVREVRLQNGRPIVAFGDADRIEDAERLSGLELRVPEDDLHPLGAGTYYQHQLVGCTVETIAGERIGEVARVAGGAAGSVLAIDGPRGEILIPLADEICVEVQPDARRIRIDPPEGLLELNETKQTRRMPPVR